MKSLESIIPMHLATALGETFMHSLWQLAGLAILMAIALAFVNRKSAVLRYRIGSATLLLMALFPMVTFFLIYEPSSTGAGAGTASSTIENGISQIAFIPMAGAETTFLERVGNFFDENAYWIVALWLMGALFFTLRFTGSYLQIRRLRRRNTSPAPAFAIEMLAQLSERMGIRRRVRLLQSGSVDTPLVIGTLKPIVLIPLGMLSGLSTEQVECILAHELAHVRRWDFLVNVLQSIVEIALFYHPAIWWTTKMIREERENCCDQIVVDLKENRLEYAKALLNLEVLRSKRPGLAMGANGGKLFQRIQRITGGEPEVRKPQSRSIFLAIFSLCLVLLLTTTGKETLQASIPFFNHLPPELQFVADQTDGELDGKPKKDVDHSTEASKVDTKSGELPAFAFEVTKKDLEENETAFTWNFDLKDKGKHIVLRAIDMAQNGKRQQYMALDSPITQIAMLEDGEEVLVSFDRQGHVNRVVRAGKELPASEYAGYEAKINQVMVRGNNRAAGPMTPPPPPRVGTLPPLPPMPRIDLQLKGMPTPPPPPKNQDDEAAMRKYEAEMEAFEDRMEAWGEQMETQFDENEWEAFGEAMEQWGEELGKQIEEQDWEAFGRKMEAWGERFGEELAMSLEGLGNRIEVIVEQKMDHADRDRRRAEDREERIVIIEEDGEEDHEMADQYMVGVERLRKALDRDGLVDEGEGFKMKINDSKMYLNGKEMDASMQRKYMGIVESMGIRGNGDEMIEINFKKGNKKPGK